MLTGSPHDPVDTGADNLPFIGGHVISGLAEL